MNGKRLLESTASLLPGFLGNQGLVVAVEDEPNCRRDLAEFRVTKSRGHVQERTKDEIDRDLEIRVNKTKTSQNLVRQSPMMEDFKL